MPDIDVDFEYAERSRVIEYVTEKYGKDSVTQITTFGTMAARVRMYPADLLRSYCDVLSSSPVCKHRIRLCCVSCDTW